MNTDESIAIAEVRARLDGAATMAGQGLLDQVDRTEALEGVLGLVERARLHLKGIGL
jgi:hypothetical protein